MIDFVSAAQAAFGPDRVRANVSLAPLTTFRVGGPADWLIETRSAGEVVEALRLAWAATMPATILGGGSNVLVADGGVRGLVIRPRGGEVRAEGQDQIRADAAVTIFGAAKACVPADLVLLCDGCAVSLFRWLWLVDQAVKLKSACPF